MRLDQNTPAQIALQEAQVKKGKIKQGNRLTWIKLIGNDIKNIKKDIHLRDADLIQRTENRTTWRKIVQKTFCPKSTSDGQTDQASQGKNGRQGQ